MKRLELKKTNQNDSDFDFSTSDIRNKIAKIDVFDFETVKAPYLPLLSPDVQKKTYTLVLDLDETLVHY